MTHKVYSMRFYGFDEKGDPNADTRVIASGLEYDEAQQIADKENQKPDVEVAWVGGPDVPKPDHDNLDDRIPF